MTSDFETGRPFSISRPIITAWNAAAWGGSSFAEIVSKNRRSALPLAITQL